MTTVSKSELRKFGLTVGGAFVLLGLVSWFRGHELPPRILWTVGVLLLVPGAVAPQLLRPVQRWWMSAAAVLGHVNTRVILALMYYVVFTPVGLVMRLFRDPLNRAFDDGADSNWVRRTPTAPDLDSYSRQF